MAHLRSETRALSPVTIEHRGELFLTATGQLPRAPDCVDTDFCRCDVCGRLRDLGYGSRAEYIATLHAVDPSAPVNQSELRRQRIKARSRDAGYAYTRSPATGITDVDSKRSGGPTSMPLNTHSPAAAAAAASAAIAKFRPVPSPRLSPRKRAPLPRSAGRVVARHDIVQAQRAKEKRVASAALFSPTAVSASSSPSSSRSRSRIRSGGSRSRSRNSRSASPAPSRSSHRSPSQESRGRRPRSGIRGRSPSPHARKMPWEQISDEASVDVGAGTRRMSRPSSARAKRGGGGGGGDAAAAAAAYPQKDRTPTEELSKSELIALVLSARAQRDVARAAPPPPTASVSTAIPSPPSLSKATERLRQDNKDLRRQLSESQSKLRHESAISRELCMQVSTMKQQILELESGRRARDPQTF